MSDDQKRLDDLESRLRAARKEPERSASGSTHRQMGIAYRVMVEMAAGLAVGGFVGWWLDEWLGTRPALLLGLIVLGFAAGALNAWRAIKAYERQDGR
jgi:ATP synthase protein I